MKASKKNKISNSFLMISILLSMFVVSGCGKQNTHYTKDYVLEKCGLGGLDEFSDDGNTFNYQLIEDDDYILLNILNKENEYRGYKFCIYESEKKAKKSFEDSKKTEYEKDEFESGSNYVCGWEAGVMDASIKSFKYLTGNMIVSVNDEVIGVEFDSQEAWQEWHDEYFSADAIMARKEEASRVHEKIMSEW